LKKPEQRSNTTIKSCSNIYT